MRIAKWAIGIALTGCLAASEARAQSIPGDARAVEAAYGYAEADGTAPESSAVSQAAYGYAEAADEEAIPPPPTGISPSDAPMAGSMPMPVDNGFVPSCSSCGGANCGQCMDCCSLGEPLRLFGKHPSGFEAGGWVSVGGHGNEYRATLNGPLGFNNLGDGINVHQLWFFAGKEANTEGCGFDWGARVDYVFGVDAPDTQAVRGTQWDVTWDSGDYGSAIPQAYGEIAIDYLTVKAGYFYTPIGYEVVQAPQNFFYSHSYTQYYIEPFTHTGALATYDGFENFTFYGGWSLGWDTAFEQMGDSNMFLGGITYSMNEDVSLTYMTSSGRLDFSDSLADEGNTYMHSIVMDLHLTDRIEWVIQSDLNHREGARRDVAAGGVNQYLFYKVNECVSVGGRFEWLYDRDAAFVQPGLASGSYYNLTGGINWKPQANFIVRPEVRYDWFSGNAVAGGLPFDNHTKDDQFSIGFDVIVLY
ncbi:MAG: porin [Thermoguttaceae bacterium]